MERNTLVETIGNKLNIPVDLMIELLHALVVPIFTYEGEVWGLTLCKDIEKWHLNFLKMVFHVKPSTGSAMVYGETASFPIYVTKYQRIAAMCCRILNGKPNKLSCFLYKCDSGSGDRETEMGLARAHRAEARR